MHDTIIWYERFRPNDLDQLSLDEKYRDKFEEYIEEEEIPHLLFHGPPGSGKTTIANILINELASNSLALNGSSSDRGVNTIKTSVKQFAMSKPKRKGKKNIIFFDEADGLTIDAQRALKNTIETYQTNCRFIFTCNNISKIDDAIYSRCQVFHFESFPFEEVTALCLRILKKEKIEYKRRKDIDTIVERYYPDVRSVLNNLQACCVSGKLTTDYLDKFNPETFWELLDSGNIPALREMYMHVNDFTRLYQVLFNEYAAEIKDNFKRADMMIEIAEYMYKDKFVADREINFTACILEILSIAEIDFDFTGRKKR